MSHLAGVNANIDSSTVDLLPGYPLYVDYPPLPVHCYYFAFPALHTQRNHVGQASAIDSTAHMLFCIRCCQQRILHPHAKHTLLKLLYSVLNEQTEYSILFDLFETCLLPCGIVALTEL